MARRGPRISVNFGDIVDVDFGTQIGSEAGFKRPGVVVVADSFLRFWPTTLFVVPLTSTERHFPSHIEIVPDQRNELTTTSYALVEQMRAVSECRCSAPSGNVGSVVGRQILEVLAMITGM